jgi:pre-mRNA-splicing factor SPF27
MVNLLQEYDFDSLPYIDKEYDHPMVSQAVHSLIEEEMKTFRPPADKYLGHLPYPELKKFDYNRSPPTTKGAVDLSRYPEDINKLAPMKGTNQHNDIGAWQDAIDNAKVVIEHERNRLMNIDVRSAMHAPVWLRHNELREGSIAALQTEGVMTRKDIDTVNRKRKERQEDVGGELSEMTWKRDQAIAKSWAIRKTLGES